MITSTTNRTRTAVSGVTYDFGFRIDSASDLKVYGIDADGVSTEITTGFTVTFDPDNETGTVTFDSEPSAYAEILRLRSKPYTQGTDVPIREGFSEEDIEGALDSLEMQIQQLKEITDYCVKQDLTTVAVNVIFPTPEDDSLIAWNGTSGAIKNLAAADFKGEKGDTGDTGATGAPGADGADGIMASIVAGTNVTVDDTDPANPIVSADTPKATGADIDTGTEDAEFVTPKAIADSALVSGTEWTDYSATSTIVGWASFTEKKIYTKKIGNTVFVEYTLSGTSNAQTATFTVPYTHSTVTNTRCLLGMSYDNGAILTAPSALELGAGSADVTCFKTSGYTANSWTSSGLKHCQGQFFYEVE